MRQLKTLIEEVRKRRLAEGLKQEYIAGVLGMSQSNYSLLENGKIDPSWAQVVQLAKLLKIDLNNILLDNETIETPEIFENERQLYKTVIKEKDIQIKQLESILSRVLRIMEISTTAETDDNA